MDKGRSLSGCSPWGLKESGMTERLTFYFTIHIRGFPGGSSGKESTCQFRRHRQETRVQSLGWEDPLEEEMSAHTSILVWKIPRTEKPGWLQAMGSQRIRHDLATQHSTHDHINVKAFLTFWKFNKITKVCDRRPRLWWKCLAKHLGRINF